MNICCVSAANLNIWAFFTIVWTKILCVTSEYTIFRCSIPPDVLKWSERTYKLILLFTEISLWIVQSLTRAHDTVHINRWTPASALIITVILWNLWHVNQTRAVLLFLPATADWIDCRVPACSPVGYKQHQSFPSCQKPQRCSLDTSATFP